MALSPTPEAYAWQAIDYVITQSWNLAQEQADTYAGKVSTASAFIDAKVADSGLAMAPADVATDVAVTEPNVTIQDVVNLSGSVIEPTPSSVGGTPTVTDPTSGLTLADVATDITVSEPSVNIPYNADGIDLDFYHSVVQDAIDRLAGMFTSYITTYFPDDGVTNTYNEQWLQRALTTGGTGIDQTLELQFWENDRSRILADEQRAIAELESTFVAKRFPLPPGALAAGVKQIQNKALEELSKSSREIALKQAQWELENVRLAVENSIKLRQVALSTAGDYIKALASSITVANGLAIANGEIQNGLINAAANIFNARINAKELGLKKVGAQNDLIRAATAVTSGRVGIAELEIKNDQSQTARDGVTYDLYKARVAAKGAEIDATRGQADMVQAAAAFFNARTNAKELLLKRDTADAGFSQEANKANYQGDLALIEKKIDALMSEAQAVAHMAAAALNNLHANVSGSTSTGYTNSVSYGYQGDVNLDVSPMTRIG